MLDMKYDNRRITEMPRSREKQTIKDKVLSVFKDKADKTFLRKDIINLVVSAYPGTHPGSIIPSDYCYNSINKDPASFKLHLFESFGDGTFNCLGSNYTYSGDIYWKTLKVGQWKQGKPQ
ncbi:hypothetical protein HY745_11240, partial [Candidatus Desantisbacteria bacterium]|nr:hypothetical protein [Candidatus Desantisbacteria bacterium]